MKAIITHNKDEFINGIVLVDDKDYNWLNKYTWHLSHNYAQTNIKNNNGRKLKTMHRLIMGEPKNMQIDHIDNNSLNNQRKNLRIVSLKQNQMNRISQKNSTSDYKGVSWNPKNKKWVASIGFNRKTYYLGLFNNEKEAAKTYNNKAKELFGEYANLNEV